MEVNGGDNYSNIDHWTCEFAERFYLILLQFVEPSTQIRDLLLLTIVAQSGEQGVTITEMVSYSGIPMSTVSRLKVIFCKNDWWEEFPDPEDARVTRVRMTDASIAGHQLWAQKMRDMCQEMCGKFQASLGLLLSFAC